MSLLGSIGKAISSGFKAVKGIVLPAVGTAVAGPVGGLIGGAIAGAGGAPAAVSSASSRALVPLGSKTLPGAGVIAAGLGGAAAGFVGSQLHSATTRSVGTLMSDGTVRRTRRRRKGISATELKNHARVERFLAKNYKCKHGGSRGTYVRKAR